MTQKSVSKWRSVISQMDIEEVNRRVQKYYNPKAKAIINFEGRVKWSEKFIRLPLSGRFEMPSPKKESKPLKIVIPKELQLSNE